MTRSVFHIYSSDPEELAGTRISSLLSPKDWSVFQDATKRLQEDDSHTVEVKFKLQVVPDDDRDAFAGSTLYQQMEGKGMMMIDREDGEPSHTMWVVKPIAAPHYEEDSPSITLETGEIGEDPAEDEAGDRSFVNRSHMEPITPFPFHDPISQDLILCRICELHIPQWYFEKHSETCVEVHRLEAEIAECNESIAELRNTIRDLVTAMDVSSPASIPEYRGMPIFSPSTSPSMSSPLQLFNRANKMQRMGVKKMQRWLLEQLEDILQVASEVSIPGLKEEEAKEPIERQRLLSPGSERKISQIRNWSKPGIEDSALSQLVEDGERVMRQKIDNVVRMQNTIKYSEKIWREWEEKVAQTLAEECDSDSCSSGSGSVRDDAADDKLRHSRSERDLTRGDEDEGDDHSSTTSEYDYAGDIPSSSVVSFATDPTPLAPSPVPVPVRSPRPTSSIPIPMSMNGYAPRPMTSNMHTRSSTPSSVSSPLAHAQPIVAQHMSDDMLPHMDLDEGPSVATIRTAHPNRSAQNLLEPRLMVTPPLSPMIVPKDIPTARQHQHRRYSTINPVMSPTNSAMPLSPRQPSAAPLSRTNPTSIKDFDIIKPISKGAFGSVFLAKKKATGDYYAIKVLKKADMIAKNQITNVKAERMILMKQAESPFVAKLYFTFQSKEYLYLVMEYLNGGDCAALIKSLGSLPEEWTKNYIAEVVLGLEYLHERGIVHRYGFVSLFPAVIVVLIVLCSTEISNRIIYSSTNTVI